MNLPIWPKATHFTKLNDLFNFYIYKNLLECKFLSSLVEFPSYMGYNISNIYIFHTLKVIIFKFLKSKFLVI